MKIVELQAQAFRAPIDVPVRSSFGEMRDRPAVLIKAVADDGTTGWGETWCNFPTVGAEHRARLINETLAPIVCEQAWKSPVEAFETLTQRLHILAIQAGEPGPIAQTIAGVDIALWDVFARQAGEPVWHCVASHFGDKDREPVTQVPCYASGLGPKEPENQAAAAMEEGHNAFKLKVGFGEDIDRANAKAMRDTIGADAKLAFDANARWDVIESIRMAEILANFDPIWLEEPLPADRPHAEWWDLAERCPIPLAAGENLRADDLDQACRRDYLRFVQPDIAKWGGFSGCFPIARLALTEAKTFCPHFLGGGIGLIASAHLLAAAGGPGLLEVDFNPNSLRTLMAGRDSQIKRGQFNLPGGLGLGVTPDQQGLTSCRSS